MTAPLRGGRRSREHCGAAVPLAAAQGLRRDGPSGTAPCRPCTLLHAAAASFAHARARRACTTRASLQANYKDPKTGLYYYSAEVYQAIKEMSSTTIQQYLALRGAAVKLG